METVSEGKVERDQHDGEQEALLKEDMSDEKLQKNAEEVLNPSARHHFWSEGRVILTSMYVLFVSDLLSVLANSILQFILGLDANGCSKSGSPNLVRKILYIVAIIMTMILSNLIFKIIMDGQNRQKDSTKKVKNENKRHQLIVILVSMYILFLSNFISEVAKVILEFFVPASRCGVRSTLKRLSYFIGFFVFITLGFILLKYCVNKSRKGKPTKNGATHKSKENTGNSSKKQQSTSARISKRKKHRVKDETKNKNHHRKKDRHTQKK